MLVDAKEAHRGCIVTQVRLANFTDPGKALAVSALVDTGSAYITLPNACRESLGDVEQLGEVDVEMADQSIRKGSVCGPVRVRIGEFRPIAAEVRFIDITPDDDGEYEPLVGYIALEQAGAAVDMLGHRLVHVKRVDLKQLRSQECKVGSAHRLLSTRVMDGGCRPPTGTSSHASIATSDTAFGVLYRPIQTMLLNEVETYACPERL